MSARAGRIAPVVVLGGGLDGLAAAALLARAGRRVVLLERREVLGGRAASEEFSPGFRSAGLLHDAGAFAPALAQKLDLARHGLAYVDAPRPRLALEPGGPGLALWHDGGRAREALAARSPADAEAYASWRAQLERLAPVIARTLAEPPPETGVRSGAALVELAATALRLRRLGEADLLELLRIVPMAVADWMKDEFETPLLRAALAAPALAGTWLGPWSAGTAACLLAREAAAGPEPRGGTAALARALESAARAAGAELRTNAEATEIQVAAGAVHGVALAGGEAIDTDTVLSTLEPKRTLLGLVPRAELPPELAASIRSWRTRGTTAKLHLALEGLPDLPGRKGETHARLSSGAELDELERAFDAVKYRRMSERPWLDVAVPTLDDPSLAPEGRHVLSVLVHYAPHDLEGGWTDEAHARLERSALSLLEELWPGVAARTIACETLAPSDLESRYGLTGGHVHHGEVALDQMLFLRPTRECARHATPVAGLFLGGSGTHAGGLVHAGAGALAAARVLARAVRARARRSG